MKSKNNNAGSLHLGAFYFFHFASLGAFIPYWAIYLADLGYGAKTIGLLTSLLMVTKIFAPYVWGWLADRGQSHIAMIRLGASLSALCFAAIFLVDAVWQMALVIFSFGFFWNAVLPQFEVITMMYLGEDTHHYSKIRLWGSVGFICSSVLLAPAVGYFGLSVFPLLVLLLLTALWMNTLLLHEVNEVHTQEHQQGFWKHCISWPVVSLLLICFLNQVSHGPYYAFFSLYLEQQGYPLASMGIIWSVAVMAEIVVFVMVYRWLPVAGAPLLLLLAVAVGSIRWLLLAFAISYWPLLMVSQLLHAATFGLAHAAAIHMIDQKFRGALRGRGQALYSGVSFGLGGAIGSLLSGMLWDSMGGDGLFVIAAIVSAIGALQFLAAGWSAFRYNKRLFN